MKRLILLAIVVIVAGVGSYCLTRILVPPPPAHEDQIVWLQREFNLSDEQMARVSRIHRDYIPVCSDHCAAVVDARERLAAAPDDAGLRAEVARLEQTCSESTLQHVRDIAACMNQHEGRRFLQLVEPRIARHQHQSPFGLK